MANWKWQFNIYARKSPMIPRIGMQTQLPGTQNEWKWFGSRPSRKLHRPQALRLDRSAFSGVRRRICSPTTSTRRNPATAAKIRWASFSGAQKEPDHPRLLATHLLEVSAYPHSPLDIELARHPEDLRGRRHPFHQYRLWADGTRRHQFLGSTSSRKNTA